MQSLNKIKTIHSKRVAVLGLLMTIIGGIGVSTLVLTTTTEQAYAATDKCNIQLAHATRDFSGCNLSGSNFSDADLSGVNFSHADLSRANFSNVNLSGANLSYANLSNANLSNDNLTGANLSHANLSGANLSNINLHNANVSGVIISSSTNISNIQH